MPTLHTDTREQGSDEVMAEIGRQCLHAAPCCAFTQLPLPTTIDRRIADVTERPA